MAVVYFHRRKDTNKVFYVGIGKTRARSKSTISRNKFWWSIVNKVAYDIEIVHNDLSWDEACKLEIKYIKEFGRRDLGLGELVNMTDGGDGIENPSQETRKKISKGVSGEKHGMFGVKQTDQVKEIIRNANIGDNNYWRHNKMTLEHRKKLSLAKIGKRAPNSKVSNDDVLWIRENYIPKDKIFGGIAIAKKYNLTKSAISGIINRKTYTDI